MKARAISSDSITSGRGSVARRNWLAFGFTIFLRHTFASTGAGLNVGLPLIGALLGHSSHGTTAKYAHLAADPTRHAGAQIARKLSAELASGGTVVAFPGGRGGVNQAQTAPLALKIEPLQEKEAG
jgi:hypothetical protein